MVEQTLLGRRALVVANSGLTGDVLQIVSVLGSLGAQVSVAAGVLDGKVQGSNVHTFFSIEPADFVPAGRLAASLEEVDVLVNVQRAQSEKENRPFESISDLAWDESLKLDLTFPYFTCVTAAQGMRKRHWGRVINIISLSARSRPELSASTTAMQAGVIGFSRCLAAEMGEFGITVNCVALGAFESQVNDEFAGLASVPAGRLGNAGDLSAAVAFLSTDAAGFINGETVNVNGGYFTS